MEARTRRFRWLWAWVALWPWAACTSAVLALGGDKLSRLSALDRDTGKAIAPDAAALDQERGFSAVPVGRVPAHVTALARTRGGALWAGTFDAGLHRAAPGAAFVEVEGLEGAGRFVNAVAVHDAALWVGTSRGLWRFSPIGRPLGRAMGGAIDALASLGGALVAGTTRGLWVVGPFGPLRPFGGRDGAALRVSALARADGALWAGTPSGLYVVRGGDARFVPLATGAGEAEPCWVTAVAALDGGVIAATDDGVHNFVAPVARYDAVTAPSYHARAVRLADAPACSTNPGAAVHFRGDVYLGTPGGVLRVAVDGSGNVLATLLHALRGVHISALAALDDAMVAGSADGDIYRLEPDR